MDFLDQHGYHTISPDQLVAYLNNGATLPDKPILITFDDGDSSQWTNAIPELRRHHFTATFFIMTVVLDKLYYLTSEQVQALDRMGMTIGAHTWDHHRVTRYADSDWETQITAPTAQLAELTGHPIKYFAYPYGLWNDEAIVHLKQAGFVAAFQLGGAIGSTNPLFTIRRGLASGLWTIPDFEEALDAHF
jgi:peptidoglycan/xylan/chitin deacetylase (PgdA/CDA1 family)